MTELPDWLTAHANFDPEREHQPIVCVGGNGALSHPYELVGWQFVDEAGSWAYAGRPAQRSDGTDYGFTIGVTLGDVGTPGSGRIPLFLAGNWRALGQSLVIRCPRCHREHRISREDWWDFLAAQRVSLSPWANVSLLP